MDTLKKVKWQPTEWEEAFVNHISANELIVHIIQRTPATQQKKQSLN